MSKLDMTPVAAAVSKWVAANDVGVLPDVADYTVTWADDIKPIMEVVLGGATMLGAAWLIGEEKAFAITLAGQVAATLLYQHKHYSGYWLCKPPATPQPDVLEEQPVVHDNTLIQHLAEVEACEAMMLQMQEVLDTYGINAQVVAYETSSPTVIKYEVIPARGTKVAVVEELGQQFSRDLGLEEGVGVTVTENIGNSRAAIFLPKTAREFPLLLDMLAGLEAAGHTLPMALGINTAGKPVTADLVDAPHAIIGGTTRSGKTVFGQVTVLGMAHCVSPADLRFTLIDPKRVGLRLLEPLPHVVGTTVTDMDVALKVVDTLVLLMHQRTKELEAAGVQDIQEFRAQGGVMAYQVVVIEEASLAVGSKMPIYDDAGKATRRTVGDEFAANTEKLTALGRAVGIHVILLTQRFDADTFPGWLRDTVDMGVCFRVGSRQASEMVLGQGNGMGRHLRGYGDAYVTQVGWDAPVRVQAPFISSEAIKALVPAIAQRWAA